MKIILFLCAVKCKLIKKFTVFIKSFIMVNSHEYIITHIL